MSYIIFKGIISGILIIIISEVSKKFPGFGGLIASLPLISVMAMTWIWLETGNSEKIINHSLSTFWFVIPSLPMFILIPFIIQKNYSFWTSLIIGCLITMILYLISLWIFLKLEIKL